MSWIAHFLCLQFWFVKYSLRNPCVLSHVWLHTEFLIQMDRLSIRYIINKSIFPFYVRMICISNNICSIWSILFESIWNHVLPHICSQYVIHTYIHTSYWYNMTLLSLWHFNPHKYVNRHSIYSQIFKLLITFKMAQQSG